MSNSWKTFQNLIRVISVILVAIAIYEELKKPPEERQWHGKIANAIPYDFRFPTMTRLREKLWNPEDKRIFTEHVFGVGWAINFHTIFQKLQRVRTEPEEPAPEDSD